MSEQQPNEKLQKVLAQAGLGSRRGLERSIKEGRITVNGHIAQLGCRVGPEDHIKVDGKIIKRAPITLPRLLVYHKPRGQIVSRFDPGERDTVFHHLPHIHGSKWIPIGRLDIQTSGLLLFTNHGDWANKWMHPRYEILRTYEVRVLGIACDWQLERLTKGIQLSDGKASFETMTHMTPNQKGQNSWYRVTLREGRNREVRRMFESAGFKISKLMRVGYGPVVLPKDLPEGACFDVPAKDVERWFKNIPRT